ncbi:MAG: DNA cytosine methyltransferase [Chloroflexi bacterium]|nr:DNA cytosine methyltransferase [Chloroflexota bacterium]
MDSRRPAAILLENVVGFATSNNGADLYTTIATLNAMGYTCDVLLLDAKYFVPQSRPRLFVVGFQVALPDAMPWTESRIRPSWVIKFAQSHPGLMMQSARLQTPDRATETIQAVLEQFAPTDEIWWDVSRMAGFLSSLSPLQAGRLETMRRSLITTAATAYRRTREGRAVWEIRRDSISGCLRTARGGSSKQSVVLAGQGTVRIRWMTAREYARLQGAPDLKFGQVSESQAKFALGDAVCVPAVAWLAQRYLVPVSRTRVGPHEMAETYA